MLGLEPGLDSRRMVRSLNLSVNFSPGRNEGPKYLGHLVKKSHAKRAKIKHEYMHSAHSRVLDESVCVLS